MLQSQPKRSYPAHGPSIWHNRAAAAPAASFLPTIRTFPAHRATLISMRALMNFKEREGWSLHIV
jgi:hypothetical protein